MTLLNPDAIRDQLKHWFPEAPSDIASIGDDDCAISEFPSRILVTTTDFINASPIGMQLGISDFVDLGYYLVTSNLSDLLGSGALPESLLLSIMWDRDCSAADFESLLSGVAQAASAYGVRVIGGDTKLGRAHAFCATAIGSAEDRSSLALHSQARPGHDIWVSGPLGSTAAATHGLSGNYGSQEWQFWAQERIRRPNLPLLQSRALSALRLSPGGIDLSDGLGVDLATLADRSGVGFRIIAEQVPVEQQVADYSRALGVASKAFAFTVGGDLQFLATAPASFRSTLGQIGLSRIGEVRPLTEGRLLIKREDVVPWPIGGHSDARRLSFADEIDLLVRSFV